MWDNIAGGKRAIQGYIQKATLGIYNGQGNLIAGSTIWDILSVFHRTRVGDMGFILEMLVFVYDQSMMPSCGKVTLRLPSTESIHRDGV
jgi:hypothetical protein